MMVVIRTLAAQTRNPGFKTADSLAAQTRNPGFKTADSLAAQTRSPGFKTAGSLAVKTKSPGFKTADYSYPLITMYDTLKQVFHTRQSELWRSTVVLCFV